MNWSVKGNSVCVRSGGREDARKDYLKKKG